MVQDRDAVRGTDVEAPIGTEQELEALRVDERVVPAAEQDKVVRSVRRPATRDHVVRVQLPMARASGEAAALAVEGAEELAEPG